jgi:cell division protein ZapA
LQLSKHLNPVPRDAQSASVEQVAEHDVPATEQPPSGEKTDNPRQAPLAHSLLVLQISPPALVELLVEHARKIAATTTANATGKRRPDIVPGYRRERLKTMLFDGRRAHEELLSSHPMDRRTVELHVAGQSYKVVSTAPEEELTRLAAALDAKVTELAPRGRSSPQAVLLAALAMAHDLEEEREKRGALERRTRDLLRRVLMRIDDALEPGDAEA